MLATRQKITALNTSIRELLQEGVYPTLLAVFDQLGRVRNNPWGQPQARLRPAYPNQVIGGEDGRDVELTFGEIRSDMVTWYNELIDSADKTITEYAMFEARRDILRRRTLHLIQASEAQITSSAGGASILKDTFNSASLVDFARTTAELNLDGGYVTLPTALNSLVPITLSGSTITDEKYPNNKPHGSLSDALSDASNTGWYASLDGGTYSVTLKLDQTAANREANGLYINPMGPVSVSVYYSNDLYNFYPLVAEDIRQEKSWTFNPVTVKALHIEITGKNVGLKRLKLLYAGYAERARLESMPLKAIDLFGSPMQIHSVRLEPDAETPQQTEIQYYVQPIYPNATTPSGWYKMTDSPVWFYQTSPKTAVISSPAAASQFRGEMPDSDENQFFVCQIGGNPVLETSRLTKGGDPTGGDLGQMQVDYTNHSWAKELDPNHSPTPADWSNFGAVTQTYWSPLTLSGYTTQPDPMQQEPAVLASHGCPLVEATTISGGSDTSRDWLVIGVKDTDWMLAPGGNYRLTTYVYMPEDTIVADKPCLLYNPLGNGGSGHPVIAPFRIYLNSELVADVQRAWSGDMEGADLSAFNVSYAYKAGWNKFEVLVYNKGPQEADLASDESLAAGGIAIYIAGNPYNGVRLVPGRKLQAHSTDEKLVSEFAIRHLIRPNDNACWAWTDTAPARNIILNYDPRTSSYDKFDGYNYEQSPVMTLFYYPISGELPTALKFAADFTREPGAPGLPKLNCYKLIINQTGG